MTSTSSVARHFVRVAANTNRRSIVNASAATRSHTVQRILFREFSTGAASQQSDTFVQPTQRVAQNEPFERTGGLLNALKSSSKPDYLLDATSLAHPVPQVEAETTSPSLSLRLQDAELYLHDESDGQSKKISGRWLRDNCACTQCQNQDTAQRQINVLKGSLDCSVSSYEISNAGSQQLSVTFGDGHTASFPAAFLLQRRSATMAKNRYGLTSIALWGSDIERNPPTVSYDEFKNGGGMGSLLHNIRTYGFSFLEGLPATPETTEAVLKSIGPIRDTHYGAFYDFTSDLTMKDTAYTAEALEPHTDNTYFTEPAGLQALHMLSHTDGTGGESSLVDGFNAATQLFVEDKHAYRILSRTGVYAHASGNDGISIQPAHAFPTLNHDPEGAYLTQVRWNNADRAGVAADFEELDAWYDAAAKFDALLSAKHNQYWFQLKPGQLLIFDNWRALHGRAAFTGKRRMCGGYINRDDFLSKYRQTNLSKEDIASSTVSG